MLLNFVLCKSSSKRTPYSPGILVCLLFCYLVYFCCFPVSPVCPSISQVCVVAWSFLGNTLRAATSLSVYNCNLFVSTHVRAAPSLSMFREDFRTVVLLYVPHDHVVCHSFLHWRKCRFQVWGRVACLHVCVCLLLSVDL